MAFIKLQADNLNSQFNQLPPAKQLEVAVKIVKSQRGGGSGGSAVLGQKVDLSDSASK